MPAAVGAILFSIKAQIADFKTDMNKAAGEITGFTRRAEQEFGRLKNIGKTLISAYMLKSVYDFARETYRAAGDLYDFSNVIGMNVEDLQSLQFQCEKNGMAQEAFNTAIMRFARNISEAKSGNTALKKSFEELAVKPKNVTDTFYEVAAAISQIKSESEKMRRVIELFGRGAGRLSAIFASQEKMKAELAYLKSIGVVIDAELIEKGDQADDALLQIGTSLRNIGRIAALEFAPAITKAADTLIKVIPDISKVFDEVFSSVETGYHGINLMVYESQKAIISAQKFTPFAWVGLISIKEELEELKEIYQEDLDWFAAQQIKDIKIWFPGFEWPPVEPPVESAGKKPKRFGAEELEEALKTAKEVGDYYNKITEEIRNHQQKQTELTLTGTKQRIFTEEMETNKLIGENIKRYNDILETGKASDQEELELAELAWQNMGEIYQLGDAKITKIKEEEALKRLHLSQQEIDSTVDSLRDYFSTEYDLYQQQLARIEKARFQGIITPVESEKFKTQVEKTYQIKIKTISEPFIEDIRRYQEERTALSLYGMKQRIYAEEMETRDLLREAQRRHKEIIDEGKLTAWQQADLTRLMEKETAEITALGEARITKIKEEEMRRRIHLTEQEVESTIDSLRESFKTERDIYQRNLAQLAEARQMGILDAGEYEKFRTRIEDMYSGLLEASRQTAETMRSSFSDLFFDVMQGKLGDFVTRFKQAIDRIAADWAATMLFNWLQPQAMGAGGILKFAFGGGRQEGGPVSPDKVYLAGEKEKEIFISKERFSRDVSKEKIFRDMPVMSIREKMISKSQNEKIMTTPYFFSKKETQVIGDKGPRLFIPPKPGYVIPFSKMDNYLTNVSNIRNEKNMVYGGGRAQGGTVSPNRIYMVGEKEPEIFSTTRNLSTSRMVENRIDNSRSETNDQKNIRSVTIGNINVNVQDKGSQSLFSTSPAQAGAQLAREVKRQFSSLGNL